MPVRLHSFNCLSASRIGSGSFWCLVVQLILSSDFSHSRQLSRNRITKSGKNFLMLCSTFRILHSSASKARLARATQHARLILAKHQRHFNLFSVSDGLGKMAQLQSLSSSESVLCVVRSNQTVGHGILRPWFEFILQTDPTSGIQR